MGSAVMGTGDNVLKECLRFEEMLSEIFARVMAAPLDRFDHEIEAALGRAAEFLRIDQCCLLEISEEKPFVRITHAVNGEGVRQPASDENLAELFPWSCKMLLQGESVNIGTLDDFPEEASMDRRSHAAAGNTSILQIPLSVNGRVARAITVILTRSQHVWPEAYIPRLRLLGETLSNGLERMKGREQLESQLRFESLLAEISGRFVNVPAERVDDEIEYAQKRISDGLGVDLSVLWQWSDNQREIRVTHYYRPLGGPPVPSPLNASEYYPWCLAQFKAGKIINLSSPEDYPPEADRDKESALYFGVKSTLTFPLSTGGGMPIGALAFSMMREKRIWPEALIDRLKLVAQIFANALARRQAETALWESEARLRLTAEAVDAGLWVVDAGTGDVWASQKARELFQFSPDEGLHFERFFEAIHPDDRERVRREVDQAYLSGEILHSDYRVVLPDGNMKWFTARGQGSLSPKGDFGRMLGMTLDITRRKEVEIKLAQSQAQLSSLFDSTKDLIWSVDKERFGLSSFNRSLAEYFLKNHNLPIKIGMTPDDLLPPGYAAQWHDFYKQALKHGSFNTDYGTSGGGRTLHLSINRLDDGDEVLGISVFAHEMTERKRLEQQLKDRLEEIEALKLKVENENIYLREEVRLLVEHSEIVGQSKVMMDVLSQAEQVARTDSTVLILGETGTGKEVLARAIHNMSKRKGRTLVTVNCASLPPNLIESELFGREKGAYTGALTRMIGRFETADGSTLFLDEIGEMPFDVQSKLLRVLEQGVFERLGSTRTIHAVVRIIAATNRDLSLDVKEGRFRKDLFYRLNVFPITIPSLRDRSEDIPALIWSFVKQFEKTMGKRIDSVPKKIMEGLVQYGWPGNIRELRNVVEHAMILSAGKTLAISLPEAAQTMNTAGCSLEDMERRHIIETLERTGWRLGGKGGAADSLGMKRTTLQSKMKALGISRDKSS